MSDSEYRTGDVLEYPYLWRWQFEQGETEGRKDRPCCLALSVPLASGQTCIYLLPITTKQPLDSEIAEQIPEIEAKRAGLSSNKRQWVVLSEWNRDILETSYYLDRREPVRGRFSKAFLNRLLATLKQQLLAGSLKSIHRRD